MSQALISAVSEIISVLQAMAAQTPSGGHAFEAGINRARAQLELALGEFSQADNPPEPEEEPAPSSPETHHPRARR